MKPLRHVTPTRVSREYARPGASLRTVARKLGCNPATVHVRLRAAGVVTRPVGQPAGTGWKASRKINPVQSRCCACGRRVKLPAFFQHRKACPVAIERDNHGS